MTHIYYYYILIDPISILTSTKISTEIYYKYLFFGPFLKSPREIPMIIHKLCVKDI